MEVIRLMVDEVKTCVDAKINFFEEYFSVPDDLKSEMDMFIKDTQALGEQCSSASEFEQQFSASELLNRFNTLVSKCTPKAKKMTKEEKIQSIRKMLQRGDTYEDISEITGKTTLEKEEIAKSIDKV